jgi:hypothetical protein
VAAALIVQATLRATHSARLASGTEPFNLLVSDRVLYASQERLAFLERQAYIFSSRSIVAAMDPDKLNAPCR